MAIIRSKEQFHLKTKHMSYIFSVYQNKYLTHLYWGSGLNEKINLESYVETAGIDRPACNHHKISDSKWVFEMDLRKEFSALGKGDYRVPTVSVRTEDGSTVSDFQYHDFHIYEGKTKLKGLPSLDYKENDRVETLEIILKDLRSELEAVLVYTVYEDYDVITRNIRYQNKGNSCMQLLKAHSMNVDFPAEAMNYIHFPGDWCREREFQRVKISNGVHVVGSNKGYGSHATNPFLIVCDDSVTEHYGNTYGFSLVYSGNFRFQIEQAEVGTTRISAGLGNEDFLWNLRNGETFQTPEVIMTYSKNGFNGMSRNFHKIYQERLFPETFRNSERPIVINNWEGTGPDFTEDQLIKIMDVAAYVGAEVFVLDDGWFGEQNCGTLSCGDWYPNKKKLPHGLKYLADEAKKRGLKFGLWFEPEMMAVTSSLFQQHPEWCIHSQNTLSEPQYGRVVLDLSKSEVCDYIVDCITNMIEENGIQYIKWDCNRYFTETEHQMQPHQYMLGLYSVLEKLKQKFPEVLFEGCASGGGRFDPAILSYMPQIWCSDMAKPYSRLMIQHGTSYGYPAISMTAHVGKMDVGYERWNSYLHFYTLVAMAGNFGLEMDLNLLSNTEREQMKGYVNTYKSIRRTIQQGVFYRLEGPFDGKDTTWEYVNQEQSEAVVFYFSQREGLNAKQHYVRLRGLISDAVYQVEEKCYTGEALMKVGISLPADASDYTAKLYILKKIGKES